MFINLVNNKSKKNIKLFRLKIRNKGAAAFLEKNTIKASQVGILKPF